MTRRRFCNLNQPCFGQAAQVAIDGTLLQRTAFKQGLQCDPFLAAEPDQGGKFGDAQAAWRQLCVVECGNAVSGLAKGDDVASLDGQLGDAPHEWAYMLQVSHAQPPLRKLYRRLGPLL